VTAPRKKHREAFLLGNEAVVEGALAAGCSFYAGYPITPSTEIMECMAKRLPHVPDGVFLQMEDEIASMGAVIGASLAGRKAMTATSGPGFSLMQEQIGYAAMTETPLVLVNVMRMLAEHRSADQSGPGRCAAGPLGHPRRSSHHRALSHRRARMRGNDGDGL